jgi:hypothetical protein
MGIPGRCVNTARWLASVMLGLVVALAGPVAHGAGPGQAGLPPGIGPEAAGRPDLSGTWVLDPGRSDDPGEAIEEARRQARAERSRGVVGLGRRGDERTTGDAWLSRGTRGAERALLGRLPERIGLEQGADAVTFVLPTGERRAVHTDNRGASVSASGAMDQEVVIAGWEGDTLVVETTLTSGERLVERYRLEEGPRRLRVDTLLQIPGLSEPVPLERLYEPARDSSPAGSGRYPFTTPVSSRSMQPQVA